MYKNLKVLIVKNGTIVIYTAHSKNMISTKVTNTISAFVHDENLATINKLKAFLEEKMDDADEVTDLIDEFASTLSLTKVKGSKNVKVSGDKPKRTRKPTFYNYWLGKRLRSFGEEQKELPEDERVGKTGRMKVIADEWKEFKKNSDAFDEAREKWEESEEDNEENKPVKEKKKTNKKTVKEKKKTNKKTVIVSDSDSDSGEDSDNSPTTINSDSEEDD